MFPELTDSVSAIQIEDFRGDLSNNPVWRYFDHPQTQTGRVINRNQMVCSKCQQTLKYDGSMIPLRKHLRAAHPDIVKEINLPNDDPEMAILEQGLKKISPGQEMKFMKDFHPGKSGREQRKQTRNKQYSEKKHQTPALYNDRGIHIKSGADLCDCLDEQCVGCHFPCSKCKSTKCGHECRVNRRGEYDSIEIEGTDVKINNKYKH